MSKGIKCKNCKHVVFYDDIEEIWWHKHPHHNENCECRKPEPNLKPIQKEYINTIDKITEEHKNDPYDYSRGWNSLSFEEQHRPFTI